MQCFSEAIWCCNAEDNIAFITVIAEKGIKFVPKICALFYADDPLLICIIHEVLLEELMELPCVSLEVGAT